MSGRLLILISLSVCALTGCESPDQSHAIVSQPDEQPKIIQHAAVPARKPVIANSPSPVFGEYDSALIKAVQIRWEELLNKSEHTIGKKAGQVVVKFKLHADGNISDLAASESNLGSDLVKVSLAAIAESAPFGPWPDEMKAKVEGDFRELTCKFRYQ